VRNHPQEPHVHLSLVSLKLWAAAPLHREGCHCASRKAATITATTPLPSGFSAAVLQLQLLQLCQQAQGLPSTPIWYAHARHLWVQPLLD